MSISKQELDKYIEAYNRGEALIPDEEKEIWKDISYRDIKPNKYQVSSYGRIRRKDTLKLMTPNIRGNGYAHVRLAIGNGGHSRIFTIHRIVAYHFCDGYDMKNANIVNHIDGVKINNFYKNLEWCDQKHNAQHAFDTGLCKPVYGENTNRHTITSEIAHLICQKLIQYEGSATKVLSELMSEGLTISVGLITAIKEKETWTAISDGYFIKDQFKELHTKQIELICEKLCEYSGDVQKVYDDLKDCVKDISLRKINDIKLKVRYANISDKFFKHDQFGIYKGRLFTKEEVRKICETIVKMKGNNQMVYNELKDEIKNITPGRVMDIKNKGCYEEISDEYFKRGEFKEFRHISTDDLDMIRALTLSKSFINNPIKIFDIINHEKHPKITKSVINMIYTNHDAYARSNIYNLEDYKLKRKNRQSSSIPKIILDRLIKSYSSGDNDITDEAYDALLEEYLKEHGGESARPYNNMTQTQSVNKLVCTLPKSYGVTSAMREGQLTYEQWFNRKGFTGNEKIIIQAKFDGCSVAYDVNEKRYFTRGDYDNGESVDVTELFEQYHDPANDVVSDFDWTQYSGVKFEAILCHQMYNGSPFESYYKRPRDVVAATITSRNVDNALCISLIPLRVLDKDGVHRVAPTCKEYSKITTSNDFEGIQEFINSILDNGATFTLDRVGTTFDIDGVVVSVLNDDDDIVDEIAIKILNNIKETKIINIEYQYGKTGKITPVGILEPVKFDNITVDHVGLSTLDRVVSLNLKYNDTVRVVYNIVPYLLSSYGDGTYPIPIPKKCPICGAELNFKTLKTVRCTNPKCKGLKIGFLNRYCEKMGMVGISKGIITKLFEAGLLSDISDLYKLKVENLLCVDGFKDKLANNVINEIQKASTNVQLSRWLGALPLKDISAKTWQIIIDAAFNHDEMKASNVYRYQITTGTVDTFMEECVPPFAYGIGERTYSMIKESMAMYWEDIKETINYISFDCTTKVDTIPTKGRVTLTGFRDSEIISLLTLRGYDVNDFSSKTMALVIPYTGYVSSKVSKAKRMGIPIYLPEEAKEALK